MWKRGLAFLLRWRLGVSFALDRSQWQCRNTVVETYSCGSSPIYIPKLKISIKGSIRVAYVHPSTLELNELRNFQSKILAHYRFTWFLFSTVRAQYSAPTGPQCQRRKRGGGSSLGCLLKRHVVVADGCTSTFSLHCLKRCCFRPRIRDRISPLLPL